MLDNPIYDYRPSLPRDGHFSQPLENLDRFRVRPVVEEIPKYEDVCVVDRLRSEEIVRLDRDMAVTDRVGLVPVPVLHEPRQYICTLEH